MPAEHARVDARPTNARLRVAARAEQRRAELLDLLCARRLEAGPPHQVAQQVALPRGVERLERRARHSARVRDSIGVAHRDAGEDLFGVRHLLGETLRAARSGRPALHEPRHDGGA